MDENEEKDENEENNENEGKDENEEKGADSKETNRIVNEERVREQGHKKRVEEK